MLIPGSCKVGTAREITYWSVIFFICCLAVCTSSNPNGEIERIVQIYLEDHSALVFRIFSRLEMTMMDFRLESNSLLTDICVWDPTRYMERNGVKLFCSQCEKLLYKTNRWRTGDTSRNTPRTVYDENRLLLIVSRQYRCANSHEIWTHDEVFTNYFEIVPFILYKKSGITKELRWSIIHLVDETNVNFASMERLYREKYHSALLYRQKIVRVEDPVLTAFPSNDFLEKIYIEDFLTKESIYHEQMTRLNAQSISCNHTFKVAANIGFKNPTNGSWVQMYDSVFCVLNENGQVVKWCFTKGTSFDKVTSLFSELKCRLFNRDMKLHTVYVDNCCSVRKKLESIFGHDINVKLDLFHAVHRVPKAVSNRNPLYTRFSKELRYCFRQPADCTKERNMKTPTAQEISLNLKQFKGRWESLVYKDKAILNTKSSKEIENLLVHAEKGCLSDIPPGAGTERNENLHGIINKFLYRKRIGIKLAYALFTKVFARRNDKIVSNSFQGPIEQENFGFLKTECSSILKPELRFVNEYNSENVANMLSVVEHELALKSLENDEGIDITNLQYYSILHKCLMMWLFYIGIKNTKLNDIMTTRSIPFLFVKSKPSPKSPSNHIDNDVLKLNGLERMPVLGDGNCFFTSTYITLKNTVDTIEIPGNRSIKLTEISADEFVLKLREIMVDEWLKHMEEYIGQTTYEYDEYVFEANQFLEDGYYQSELGDTMVNCLSNALGVNVILFSDNDTPMQAIRPSRDCRIDKPICLVHSSEGAGHYDAAVFLRSQLRCKDESDKHENSSRKLDKGCSCGKNGRDSIPRCAKNEKYKTRCPCFFNKTECTSRCRCRNCRYGQNGQPLDHLSFETKNKTTYKTSMNFAAEKGEDTQACLGLNFVEFFLLHEVRQIYNKASGGAVRDAYNDVCTIANMLFVDIPLQAKSERDICKAIKSLEINKEIVRNVNGN